MRNYRIVSVLAAVSLAAVLGVAPLSADDTSMMNEEEKALHQVEQDVLSLQMELSAARKRGDDPEKIEELQKKFDKLQKRRVGLLRQTWQL